MTSPSVSDETSAAYDLDDLIAKANAATPGRWDDDRAIADDGNIVLGDGHRVAWIPDANTRADADATYIASLSPDVLIAIATRLTEAEAALARVQDLANNRRHYAEMFKDHPDAADLAFAATADMIQTAIDGPKR